MMCFVHEQIIMDRSEQPAVLVFHALCQLAWLGPAVNGSYLTGSNTTNKFAKHVIRTKP